MKEHQTTRKDFQFEAASLTDRFLIEDSITKHIGAMNIKEKGQYIKDLRASGITVEPFEPINLKGDMKAVRRGTLSPRNKTLTPAVIEERVEFEKEKLNLSAQIDFDEIDRMKDRNVTSQSIKERLNSNPDDSSKKVGGIDALEKSMEERIREVERKNLTIKTFDNRIA